MITNNNVDYHANGGWRQDCAPQFIIRWLSSCYIIYNRGSNRHHNNYYWSRPVKFSTTWVVPAKCYLCSKSFFVCFFFDISITYTSLLYTYVICVTNNRQESPIIVSLRIFFSLSFFFFHEISSQVILSEKSSNTTKYGLLMQNN